MTRASRPWVPMLLGTAGFAVVVFGAVALFVGPPVIVADGLCYNTAAMRLLNTGIYSYLSLDTTAVLPPNAFITPGYILILAAMYSFLPHGADAGQAIANAIPSIVAIHFLCAIGTVALTSATGYLIGGLKLGWTAGILAGLYLPFGAEAMSGWSENVGLLFTTACLFLAVGLYQSEERVSRRWMMGFGLCGGASVMVRPAIALWLVVPIIFWVWKRRSNMRWAIKSAAIGCAMIAVVMAPWVIRNAVVFGRFVPLTTHAGTVWIDSVGGIKMTQQEKAVYTEAVAAGQDGFRVVAFDRMEKMWRADPSSLIMDRVYGVWTMVRTPWCSQLDPRVPLSDTTSRVVAYGYRMLSVEAYRAWQMLIGALHALVLALGLAGLILKRDRWATWLVASVPIYTIVLTGIMGPRARYFYPTMPAVLLLASVCLIYIYMRVVVPHRVGGVRASRVH